MDKNDAGISLDIVNEWTYVIGLGAQVVNEINDHFETRKINVKSESALTKAHQGVDVGGVSLDNAVAGCELVTKLK